jgi:hypothetical protein
MSQELEGRRHLLSLLEAVRKLTDIMEGMVGHEMMVSLVVSRIAREARRLHGVDGGRRILQRLLDGLPDGEQADVFVPDAAFRMGSKESAVWSFAGAIIDALLGMIGEEPAYAIILTSTEVTKPVLHGFIESMAEAAQYDL